MLKAFFSIPVNADGRPYVDRTKTRYYKLFKKLNIGKLRPDIFDSHFAVYPVIHLDFQFKQQRCSNYEEAIDYCKSVVQTAFREHAYLSRSEKLTKDDKLFVDKWLTTTTAADYENEELDVSLTRLAQLLRKHFVNSAAGSGGVLVLVDDYDAIVIKSTVTMEDSSHLNSIIYLYADMVLKVCRDNEHVKMSLITGTLNAVNPGYGLSSVNINRCTFLNEHKFVPFYGFTEKDVQQLLRKKFLPNEQQSTEKAIRSMYNGYRSKNEISIYRPYSVRNYFLRNTTSSKVENGEYRSSLKIDQTFALETIREQTMILLKRETIEIHLIDHRSRLEFVLWQIRPANDARNCDT